MLAFDANFALALVIVIAAGITRGFSGVAAAMILVPGFSYIFGPVVAVATMLLMEMPALAQMVPQIRRQADWRAVWPLALSAAVMTPAGAYLLLIIDPEPMRRAIGVIVLVFVCVLAMGWRYSDKPKLAVAVASGATSGFIGAATGIGGPPIILYFMSVSPTAQAVRANITGYWALRFIVLFGAYAWYGLFTQEILFFSLALTPFYLAAVWVGGRLFHLASEVVFRRIAHAIVAAMGLLATFA